MRLPRRMRWPSISTTARTAELLALVGWLYEGAALCCGEGPGAVAGRCGGVEIRTRGEAVGGLDGSLGGTCGGGCSLVMFAAKQSSIRISLFCGDRRRTGQASGGLAVAVHVRLRLRRVVSVQALSRTVRCFQASDGLFSQATCPDILPWTNER